MADEDDLVRIWGQPAWMAAFYRDIPKICAHCGNDIARNSRKKYCNDLCKREAKKFRVLARKLDKQAKEGKSNQ